MFLHVTQATYLGDYRVYICLNDGSEGTVDLEPELEGEVFGPLRDTTAFQDFHIDPELHTVVWSNGADLAPEFLRALLRAAA